VELQALRSRPDLETAADLHLEIARLYRRVQGRVPLPSITITADLVDRHQREATPILQFEDIPVEPSDLRLMVRQTADVLRRFGALEDDDHERIQELGRDARLMTVTREWYRRAGHSGEGEMLDEVLRLALQPFLSRCAEVLQPWPELSRWTHPHCALCGGEPTLAVITPAAERHLVCGRCELRWKWEPLTCPYCGNDDRARITSFATADGQYRVYGCDGCQRYLKAYDGRRTARPMMPIVEAVATLPLDAAAIQRGYTA
jgi:formate dehydrogenase maturation protein FdhE